MAALEVDITRGGEAIAQLLGPKAQKAVAIAMRSTALRAKTLVVDASRRAPPASANGKPGAFNTGAYARAWKAVRAMDGGSWAVHVFNQMPYAGVIEYGRRPGKTRPPIAPIAVWAQRRLGLPYKEARGLAFVIARSIGRRGLEGRHVLTSSEMTDKLQQAMQEEVLRELIKAWRRP